MFLKKKILYVVSAFKILPHFTHLMFCFILQLLKKEKIDFDTFFLFFSAKMVLKVKK